MVRGRCPICEKAFEAPSLDQLPWFPFCSERCRLIDLGRWIDGAYAIPGPPVKGEDRKNAAPAEHPVEADPDTESE